MSKDLLDETFAVVKGINKAICEAIDHGGDTGGPYFCNYDDLRDQLEELAISLSRLSGHQIMVVDTYDYNGRCIKKYNGEEWRVPMLEVVV